MILMARVTDETVGVQRERVLVWAPISDAQSRYRLEFIALLGVCPSGNWMTHVEPSADDTDRETASPSANTSGLYTGSGSDRLRGSLGMLVGRDLAMSTATDSPLPESPVRPDHEALPSINALVRAMALSCAIGRPRSSGTNPLRMFSRGLTVASTTRWPG
jgi:hypothetical protein